MFDASWQLEITRPFLLIGLIALPWLVYYFRRSLVDFARVQRVASLVTRSLIVALLVFSLADLTLLRPTSRQYVVLAIDESLSVGQPSQATARDYIQRVTQALGRHQSALVRFAKTPATVETPSVVFATSDPKTTASAGTSASPGASRAADRSRDRQWRMGSNLAAAIELATAAIPPFHVPQVVLLSDGNQTEGDALRSALAAGVPISTVPLATRSDPEVQVAQVNVPAQVRQGEPFYVEVVIDSNHDDVGRIEIYRGDVKVNQQGNNAVKIKAGENRFRFRQVVTDQRLITYTVRISGFEDKLLDNNSGAGLVSAEGQPLVLLVDSDIKTTDHLRWALEEQSIHVVVRPPAGIPATLAEAQNFDCIMLSNVPATALSLEQMDVIQTYVQDLGGGLVMLGGDQSFGLGGYYKTPLEDILPVRSDFEKEEEKPSLAMVLVIDKSGSMGGTKMELAKDAAKSAVELLGSRDQIGVIAFDGASYWVSEINNASNRNFINQRISTIEAGGGTSMYPPLVKAYTALASVVAKLKHVILLTDGISAPGDFADITAQMAADRITVSTVAVGQGADQNLLEAIARQGNGRYYFCDRPQSVPQIFAKETIRVSKSAINELPFVPQLVRPTQVLGQLDMASAPFLLGFVVTRPKPTSEFILATETGEPLLAWWRYGLGMVVAFTSDAKSRWAAEWLTWPGFGTFWSQIVRHAMRPSEAKGIYVEVERRGEMTEVRLDAVDADGSFQNNAETVLSIIGPEMNGQRASVPMRQTAPGRYVAKFPTTHQGAYHLELALHVNSRLAFRQSRGFVVGYPDELRLRPTNEDLLRKIADVSGGRFNPTPAQVLDVGDRRAHRSQPLWPFLLAAAAVLFLADVALRRIDFSLLVGPRAT